MTTLERSTSHEPPDAKEAAQIQAFLDAGVYNGIYGGAADRAREMLGISSTEPVRRTHNVRSVPDTSPAAESYGAPEHVVAFAGGVLAAHGYDASAAGALDATALELIYGSAEGERLGPDDLAYLLGDVAVSGQTDAATVAAA